MSVILLILKIIGWILLTLPALFLLIVFLVLVVPVRYRTDGSIEENIRVQGKVHWLLHILSFGFSYNEEGFSYTLKLFGKRIALGEKLEDEEEEPDADSTDTAVHETKAEVENILPSDSKMQRQDVSVKDAAEANEKKDSKDVRTLLPSIRYISDYMRWLGPSGSAMECYTDIFHVTRALTLFHKALRQIQDLMLLS